MRRITLDANVLAPAFVGKASASRRLIQYWQAGRYELIVSEHLLEELANAFADRYFRIRFSPEDAASALELLRTDAVMTELMVPVHGIATHPEDDLVLSTALSGEASVLCTNDKQLLKLGAYRTTEIVSPGELLARLGAEDRERDVV